MPSFVATGLSIAEIAIQSIHCEDIVIYRSNGSNKRAPTDKQTDTHTDVTKRIIAPATWSIMTQALNVI